MNPLNQWTCTVCWLSVPLCRRTFRQALFDMCNVWFMSLFSWFCGRKGITFMNIFQINMQKSIFSPFCIPKTFRPTVVYLTCVP